MYIIRTIVVNITHSCNLDCSYCFAKNKSNKEMSFETLKEIVEKEAKLSTIDLEFLGGEPLLKFNLIKQIYEYIKENNIDVNRFYIITNGTLLDEEKTEWLTKHNEFFVILSMDSNKEIHNKHRSNSYDKIPFETYRTRFNNPFVNITLMEEGIPTLYEDIIKLHSLGVGIRLFRANGVNFNNKYLSEYTKQLELLLEYYNTHTDIIPCTILQPEYLLEVDLDGNNYKKCCGECSNNFKYYESNGVSNNCNYMLSLSSKNYDELKDIIKNNSPLIAKECSECPLKYLCCYCYGQNNSLTGNPLIPDVSNCEFRKIEMVLLCKYISKNKELLKQRFIKEEFDELIRKSNIILKYFTKEKNK